LANCNGGRIEAKDENSAAKHAGKHERGSRRNLSWSWPRYKLCFLEELRNDTLDSKNDKKEKQW